MLLLGHLREDAFGDVVVATPVGRALGISELVEIMPAGLGREPVRDAIDGARIVDHVDLAAMKTDRVELRLGGRRRHHRDESQPQHPGEIRLRHRGRSRRGFDHRRLRPDPFVAQRVQKQRPREPMLEAPGRVRALVLQIQHDTGVPRQIDTDQMGVGGPVIVRLDPPHRLRQPAPVDALRHPCSPWRTSIAVGSGSRPRNARKLSAAGRVAPRASTSSRKRSPVSRSTSPASANASKPSAASSSA